MRRHSSALLGTPTARLGAEAAVVVVLRVPLTFCGAGVAGHGARAAQLPRQWPSASHGPRRRRTRLGAIPVEPDALHEHLDVFFLETRVRAHLSGDEAWDAGFEAFVVALVSVAEVLLKLDGGHDGSPNVW